MAMKCLDCPLPGQVMGVKAMPNLSGIPTPPLLLDAGQTTCGDDSDGSNVGLSLLLPGQVMGIKNDISWMADIPLPHLTFD